MHLCRLCYGNLKFLFKKKQLNLYSVSYFRCEKCESAQTETPYWIEEAYQGFTFAKDTGMVQRTLFASKMTLALAYLANLRTDDLCLDFGGGTGLLTRFLRDYGLNAYWHDKYAKNIFAIGFENFNLQDSKPKIITAFEVFEHLAMPKEELETLFQLSPTYLFFSTKLYQGQGPDWWYFLEDGQHLQFFSKKSLNMIAQEQGYHFQTDGSTFHLFSKDPFYFKGIKKMIKLVSQFERKIGSHWPSRTIMDHKICGNLKNSGQ